jgi:hypothetical protein
MRGKTASPAAPVTDRKNWRRFMIASPIDELIVAATTPRRKSRSMASSWKIGVETERADV